MVKIISKIILAVFLSLFIINLNLYGAECIYDENADLSIGEALNNCLGSSTGTGTLINNDGEPLMIKEGFKTKIIGWTTNIATLFGILAVLGIVYGGLLMVISTGEEEKIKKGKDIIQWSILGFLAMISAGAIIALVIDLIYDLTSN